MKEDNARLYNILHTVLRHREDLDQPFAVPGDLTFDACKLDEYQDLIERNKALNQRLFGRAILAFSAELRQALFEARSFVGQASLLLVSGPDGGEQREIEQIVLSQFDPERQLHVKCRELNERVSLVHNVAEFFDQSPARSLVAISEAEFLSVTDVRALARLTSALDPTRRLVLLRTDVSEPDCGVSSVLIPRIDVEPLASRCIDLFFRLIESVEVECRAQGVNSKDISISALHEALVYHWPGNTSEVREVCRSAVAASGDTISSFGLISA